MATPEEALHAEEQALFEQEQGVVEMEAQIHAQEEGLVQMEKSFVKRNQTLVNLIGYVSDQEKSLVKRAEAIGPRALRLVKDALKNAGSDSMGVGEVLGKLEERQAMLERRREILAARMELVEEREALYAERLEAMEGAEGSFQGFEERLLGRERVIAETLRKLITAASELTGDEDEPDPSPPSQPVRRSHSDREVGGTSMRVVGGEVEGQAPQKKTASGHGPSEDKVTRRRRGRVRQSTNQFKITLEAVLGQGEKHTFFRYRADGPDDLPGLFLATPNLLKEGREVRLRIKMADVQIETTGIVSWRRQASDGQGPPGMGIEIAELERAELDSVGHWMKQHAPMVV